MDIESKNVNALRILAVDMIENAKSGHPGIALGSAPILYSLYSKILNVVPDEPDNILRDRFVLSAGHGSSIYYATLSAFGYDISMQDLKNFRKLGSITPGHPEVGVVPGVDATTGPLGQGVAMAVGMAIAERYMANRFNKADLTLFDNYTYTMMGEGCLMEGVSYEALSLAGSLKLNKLIVLYDCNGVTLDGDIKNVMEQNTLAYFKSLNFNTIEVEDGNNVNQIVEAINLAKRCKDKPSFIKINTHIGHGSVLQDSHKSHGQLLGEESVKALREKLGVSTPAFEMDKSVARDFQIQRKRFDVIKRNFKEKLKAYSRAYPGDYKVLKSYIDGEEYNFESLLSEISIDKSYSGRELGAIVLDAICKKVGNIVCGSADLSSSTKAKCNSTFFNDDKTGRNIKFGIREFAMGCISNGLALYGGIIPVNSTFLVFSDYMKPALRLTSLMKTKSISVFTHDSIAVGEDGATHQSSEQLSSLRMTPNTLVWRPANLAEVIASFESSLNHNGASCIALSRQNLVNFESDMVSARKGGYIVAKEYKGELNGIIIATGSEVSLALTVKEELMRKGYNVRVVSMPSVEIFNLQSEKYRESIIPSKIKSIFSIEAGNTSIWYQFIGRYGKAFGVDDFGGSAKPTELFEKFNLTKEEITKSIISIIKRNGDKINSLF
ncbi:MAG: transketolase [Clostridiales bacterium]|nr:transketolase [Clostridiales bacterium]